MRNAVASGCFAMLALVSPVAVAAQAVYGNIVGTVADPSGAAVPGTAGRITNIFQLALMRQWQFALRLEY